MLQNYKIWVRLVIGVSVILFVADLGLIAWTTVKQRDTAIAQAMDFSQSVHRMTLAGLTGMMLTGTVAQRAVFLDQVRQSEEIRALKVIRGEAVIGQFGPGTAEEAQTDAIESQVMRSHEPYYDVAAEGAGESLRAVLPVVAQSNYLGKNCLACHVVPEGTVLGVVSMRLSLDKVNAAVREFRIGLVFAAVALLLPVIVFVYLSVKRSVSLPLENLTRGLEDIAAGEGDLTRRLREAGRDEIAAAARAFNAFMEKLTGIVAEVKGGTGQVLRTADDLTQVAERVAANSERQSQEAYAMATQVQVMTFALDGLAAQAETVQRISAESSRHSEDGGQIIHSAAAEMRKIIATVNDSARIIHDLGRQSDQISEIVNVIKEIADQTNLLALNAAIEAARAGDQGRGFSVVADEVRKLAERTADSTHEITAMIGKIQAGTHEAIASMEAGVRRVGEGAALAEQAGTAINRIRDGVEQVVAAVDEMSSSLKEQARANGENAQKVEGIARLSEDNATAFS
ncbi:MAG: methyl-accepting chemotaxis protein, partial [Ignavibacteria bacterium]